MQPLRWDQQNQVYIWKREVIQETSEMLVAAQTYHDMEGGGSKDVGDGREIVTCKPDIY